jgi:hypothetical protein
MAAHLRVYAEHDSHASTTKPMPASVGIRLGDLLPLVALAQKLRFIWLQDFLDDEVRITSDLHDVLQAFRSVRPSA